MTDRDPIHGSTVLVTGGTGGIGLATATGLAGLGARVGIVGRSAARGAAAADAVRRRVPSAQAMGRVDLDDLQGERSYSGQRAYNQSKLANVLFTYELARRFEGARVTATVLHPGVVRTAFGHEDAGRFMRLMLPLVTPRS
jgi:NAD(P)-dependent dehydrogenase (short-subunit alcohol dehydrogenase family)